jgi:hypothetical protein
MYGLSERNLASYLYELTIANPLELQITVFVMFSVYKCVQVPTVYGKPGISKWSGKLGNYFYAKVGTFLQSQIILLLQLNTGINHV